MHKRVIGLSLSPVLRGQGLVTAPCRCSESGSDQHCGVGLAPVCAPSNSPELSDVGVGQPAISQRTTQAEMGRSFVRSRGPLLAG